MQKPKTQTAAGHSPSAQVVWNEKKVRRILQELDQSGETVTHFARRHGWTPQRLHWWISKLGWKRTCPAVAAPKTPVPPKPAASTLKPVAPQETVAKSKPLASKPTASVPSDPKSVPSFLPVHVVADSSVRPGVCPTGVLIELGPGCCIRVEPRFDAQVLRQVVQALAGAQAC